MLFYLTLTTLLLACTTAAQTRKTQLEICQSNLERSVTEFQSLISYVSNLLPTINKLTTFLTTNIKSINSIKPEKYLLHSVRSCAELHKMGSTKSGIYIIYPKSRSGTFHEELSVYCDMETDGGGWTIIQRRADYVPRQNFYQNWEAYKIGFEQIDKEFWLGNENIHILTHQENVSLRVELEDFDGATRYAKYDNFSVSNCEAKYKLHLGKYNGNAGDSLTYHNNKEFATFDYNDRKSCVRESKGGWWYNYCHESNLNGQYKNGSSVDADVVSWKDFQGDRYSLKKSEMKIRPFDFKKPME